MIQCLAVLLPLTSYQYEVANEHVAINSYEFKFELRVLSASIPGERKCHFFGMA